MNLTVLHLLFLIPVGLALAFLLWVLWSVTKELSSYRESTAQQPIISIKVRDRYTVHGLPAHAEMTRRPLMNRNIEHSYGSSAVTQYVRMPSPTSVGMRSSSRA